MKELQALGKGVETAGTKSKIPKRKMQKGKGKKPVSRKDNVIGIVAIQQQNQGREYQAEKGAAWIEEGRISCNGPAKW